MSFTLNLTSFRLPNGDTLVSEVSTTSDGRPAEGSYRYASMSADWRYMVFNSTSTDLDPNNPNGYWNTFRKDLVTGEVVLVSTAADATHANASTWRPAVSADGHYVAFESAADNLVAGITDNQTNIFRKDVATGAVVLVSAAADNTSGNDYSSRAAISADGRYVLFQSKATNLVPGDTNGTFDIFRKDLLTGAITRVSTASDGSQGDGDSSYVRLSADGRYAVFESDAENLVPGDTNGRLDIFRKDLLTGAIQRVSSDFDDVYASNYYIDSTRISADGRYVVYTSYADSDFSDSFFGNIFRKDMVTGETVCVSTAPDGSGANDGSRQPLISADGRYVAFTSDADNIVPGDTNGKSDLFLKDMVTGKTTLLPVSPDGQTSFEDVATAMSADGRHLLFSKNGVFLVDRDIGYPQARDGRLAGLTFEVGSASSVEVAWGDGTSDTVAPVGGSVNLRHAYDTKGVKAALVNVHQDGQSWSVPYTIDLAGGGASRNTVLADTMSGGAGSDWFHGDSHRNLLIGQGGRDRLYGHAGNDTLCGGAGKDKLYGGTGRSSKDMFVFDTMLANTRAARANVDKIYDFGPKYDSIGLDDAAFTNRTIARYVARKGGASLDHKLKINKAWFKVGDKAQDRNDFFIYNDKTHKLYFDPDGSGHKAMVEIAIFPHFERHAGSTLTSYDLFLV